MLSNELRAVIEATKLTLGYIYFEMGNFDKALHYFNAVTEGSDSYLEALMGLGWSAVKLEEYERGIGPLESVLDLYPGSDYEEEAIFLLGQCYLKQSYYDQALNAFQIILDLYPASVEVIREIEEVRKRLQQQTVSLEKLSVELLLLESKLLESLPLEGIGNAPANLREESRRLRETRSRLVKTILAEKKRFNELKVGIEHLTELAARRELRKDWHAYAEYGTTRALFLKSTQQ